MATAVGKRRRRRVSGTSSVGRTRRRRRVSGTSAVGRTRRRRRVGSTAAVGSHHRRRRRVGATSAGSMMKQILPMAAGMAVGVGVQHFLLRPVEAKIAQQMPMAAKFMGALEIFIGGYVALKAKSPVMKGAGLGLMAGGVQTVVKQFNLYHENPAVQGIGDYTTIQVPINGTVREMLSGMTKNVVNTSLVAGPDYMVAGMDDDESRRHNMLAGIYGLEMGELEQDNYLPARY